LYQPLGAEESEDDSEEELLPTHSQSKTAKGGHKLSSNHPRKNNPRIGNVWDSREDFDIGSASDSGSEEEGERQRRPTVPSTPQIIISESS
jgi:hypothetical protein